MPSVDRTNELFEIAQQIKRRRNLKEGQQNRSHAKTEFNICATQIGHQICSTSEKLNQLTKRSSFAIQLNSVIFLSVAKRRSIFDDKGDDIEDLTVSITNDISAMNQRLAQLEEIQQNEASFTKLYSVSDHYLRSVSESKRSNTPLLSFRLSKESYTTPLPTSKAS